MPGADAQQQVAEAHRRTTEAMLALRSTLRDEHYYLLQACPQAPAPYAGRTPRHSPGNNSSIVLALRKSTARAYLLILPNDCCMSYTLRAPFRSWPSNWERHCCLMHTPASTQLCFCPHTGRDVMGTRNFEWHTLTRVVCRVQLRFALFLDVLTPMQMALIYARTYPSSVDVVTMSKCAL